MQELWYAVGIGHSVVDDTEADLLSIKPRLKGFVEAVLRIRQCIPEGRGARFGGLAEHVIDRHEWPGGCNVRLT